MTTDEQQRREALEAYITARVGEWPKPFASQRAWALAAGMPGAFDSYRRGSVPKVETLRRLAEAAKDDADEIIQRIYGGPSLVKSEGPVLNEMERRLVETLHGLDPQWRAILTESFLAAAEARLAQLRQTA